MFVIDAGVDGVRPAAPVAMPGPAAATLVTAAGGRLYPRSQMSAEAVPPRSAAPAGPTLRSGWVAGPAAESTLLLPKSKPTPRRPAVPNDGSTPPPDRHPPNRRRRVAYSIDPASIPRHAGPAEAAAPD